MEEAPVDDPAFVRLARWLHASPAELIGLAILVLGAIVASGLLWLQATQRPTDGVNEAAVVGIARPGPDNEVAADEVAAGESGPPGDASRPPEVAGPSSGQRGAADTRAQDAAPPAPDASGAGVPRDAGVTVHITGAVRLPGVVVLPAGGRVADAVTAAGGMTATAAPERINLARTVADGEHVHIPIEGEDPPDLIEPPAPSVPPDGADGPHAGGPLTPIDINRASVAELEELPGIGPARAQAIVEYREANGPFTVPGDLRAVSGIGEATFQNIAERVTVG